MRELLGFDQMHRHRSLHGCLLLAALLVSCALSVFPVFAGETQELEDLTEEMTEEHLLSVVILRTYSKKTIMKCYLLLITIVTFRGQLPKRLKL